MNAPRSRAAVRGFSLIEVAVALFIVTLVIGGVIAMVNAMVANRQIEATRMKQEAIKTALIGFIARNHRLPCPAIPTLADNAIDADTNVREGAEARTRGTCEKTTGSTDSTSPVVTGVVPWVALGLAKDVALDAYANRFTYQVVKSATALNPQTVSGMIGQISIHSAGPGVLGIHPAVENGNQINDCKPIGMPTNPCAAVAIIISHGKDSYGAYTRSGARYSFETTVTGNDSRENANDDNKFVIKDYSEVSSNPFDDIVMALTTNDLLSSLGFNSTADLNSAFESAKNTVILAAINAKVTSTSETTSCVSSCSPIHTSCTNTAPCSVPTPYQATIPIAKTTYNIPPPGSIPQPNDPWGRPLGYAVNRNTVDADTTPTTPVFTITSLGPDGTPSSDDIEKVVTASEFIGRVSRMGL